MNNEKDNKDTDKLIIARRLIGQTIRKIINSGKVQKLNGEVVEININSKTELKDAVELQIIRPYTSASKLEYSLEWKQQIIKVIEIYDEVFEEEYEKYLKNNESIKNFRTSENETNLKDKHDESTIEPSIISPSLLESSKKLNEVIKRTMKPVNRTYVGKIDIKPIKPFTVIDGKRDISSGKIRKLSDKYNAISHNKQNDTDLGMNTKAEDIAR